MKRKNMIITLTDEELNRAIKNYVEYYAAPQVYCLTKPTISKATYSGYNVSVEVEPVHFDPANSEKPKETFALRHAKTGLFFDHVEANRNGDLKFSFSHKGRRFDSVSTMLAHIRRLLDKPRGHMYFEKGLEKAIENLGEALLSYEVVTFGEVSSQEMTFYVDELSKL